MKARLEGNRITVEFKDAYSSNAQVVKGARWRQGTRRWSYPLSIDKCKEMRARWGKELQVEAELADWYRTEVAKRDAQEARSLVAPNEQTFKNLHHIAPDLVAFLGPDQLQDAVWIANAYNGAGILAHEPGLGKTYSTVAGLYELSPSGPILVVCPRVSVKTVWHKHLEKAPWPVYAARGTRAQREKVLSAFLQDPAETKVLIVVSEMLRAQGTRKKDGRTTRFQCTGFEFPEIFGVTWAAVILDESHKLLGAMTITKGNLMSEGLRRLPILKHPFPGLRLAVSGTPFGGGGSVEGMFGTLAWCWPTEYTSFWRWAEDNFDVSEERVFLRGGGGATKTVKKINGLKGGRSEADFFKELGPRIMRRTLEEVSPAHRGLRSYEEVLCEMEPAQRKQYQAFADNGEVKVDGGIISAVGVLAEMTRARQMANGLLRVGEDGVVAYTGVSGKLDVVEQRLEEMDLLGKANRKRRKVVIASQWNQYLKALCDRIDKQGTDYHLMTGATTDAKRERMMEQFQAKGGPNLFIMNAQAGGVSITLDAADYLFQLDEMYPPEANEQLHRRIFRRSRVHSARVVYFRSENSIDTLIADNVATKLAQQLKVLDARRGLAIMRELLRTTPEGRRPYLGQPRACDACGARRNMYHEPDCAA